MGHGLRFFEPEMLARVLLGCQISETDKEDVLGWCRKRKPPVEVVECQKADAQYALDLMPT